MKSAKPQNPRKNKLSGKMSPSEKITSALRSLMSGGKEAAHEKTLDLFGFPVEVGSELIEVVDPRETPVENKESEAVNENSKGEDTVTDELTTPNQSEDAVTGTGGGSDY